MLTDHPATARRLSTASLPWLTAAIVLLVAGMTEATTVSRFALADLTGSAATIFVGTCETAQVASIDGRIYTRYQFAVTEIVKGEDPRQTRIEVSLPGGELGDRTQHITGMPSFVPGAETILFLSAPNGGIVKCCGWQESASGDFRLPLSFHRR